MRTELHCHSHYSKGTKVPLEGIPSPREIVKRVKALGLEAVSITDHNVFKAHKEASKEAKKQGILFIPGEEVSTEMGHIIGLGLNEFVPRDLSLEETVERIHEQGGIAIASHPFDIRGDGVRDSFVKADAAEVFNSLNIDRFSNIVARRRIGSFPKIAGSDAHTLEMIGNSVTIIDAHDIDSLLKGIERGEVNYRCRYASASDMRSWAFQRFSGSQEFVEQYIKDNYSPLKGWFTLRLMHKFLKNQGGFFTFLTYFGIMCSCGYGGFKAFGSL